jgi:hypothetical protein
MRDLNWVTIWSFVFEKSGLTVAGAVVGAKANSASDTRYICSTHANTIHTFAFVGANLIWEKKEVKLQQSSD